VIEQEFGDLKRGALDNADNPKSPVVVALSLNDGAKFEIV
jgi:hypothetical protein